MPSGTFLNLPEEKRKKFVEKALQEFSKGYDAASINTIIKDLGMARGSVYQYFENKLDLWLYLKEYSETVKLSYIISVNRADHKNFWEYYKAIFVKGIDFDLEAPLCSRFLYHLGFREHSAGVGKYLGDWKKKAKEMFLLMVKNEQENGQINKNVPAELAVHFLITMSMSIAELLQDRYHLNFSKNFDKGRPIFGANKTELVQAVDDLVSIMKKALK